MGGVILTLLLAVPACQQHLEIPGGDSEPVDEIIFRTADPSLSAEVATKATAVTSLSSFNVSAVTGSAGSETAVWTNVSFSGNNDAGYKADKWWPAEDASYRFYASNSALSFAASGATVAATNATDIVCAYAAAPSYKAKNTLSFEHIFARLGAVTVSAATGYTISNVSIKITPKTGGTYNLLTGAGHTDGTGWSGLATGSETVIASATGSNANDIYLVPGTYTLTASWTAARGLYTENIQNMQVDVNLTAGKINTISTTLSGNAKEVVFSVNIAPWTEQNQVVEFPTKVDYSKEYLTIEALNDNTTIKWSNKGGQYGITATVKTIQWSVDKETWTDASSTADGTVMATINAGDKIYFKGENDSYAQYTGPGICGNCFVSDKEFNVSGNIMSLVYGDDFLTHEITLSDYAFGPLFSKYGSYPNPDNNVVDASNLILPATTLSKYCYAFMFWECMKLNAAPVELPATTLASYCYYCMFGCGGGGQTAFTKAPELPATTLADHCYYAMFENLRGLVSAPELPATTLAQYCYSHMFDLCTSLTTAPELPATTLASYCYRDMFSGCTSLTSAPVLPATTLSASCYESMFYRCTSLTVAPVLPAVSLVANCYKEMFKNSSVNSVKCLAQNDLSNASNWLEGAPTSGTFIKALGASWSPTVSGIPSGWTVLEE